MKLKIKYSFLACLFLSYLMTNYSSYLHGKDVREKQDNNKGIDKETYQKAEQGDVDALNEIGNMYFDGQGVEKDDKKALEYYTKAAEKGDTDALINIGVMYANGQGVEKDDKKAFEYLTKAAEKGNANALINIGWMYSDGKGVEKDDKKAFEYLTKAAEKGNAVALFNIGVMYANGQGVEKDDKKALEYYTKAAEKGDAMALYIIGAMYLNGQGVKKDDKKAFEYYTKAAEKGNAHALYSIGVMYSKGQGVEKDDKKALEYFTKAAEKGSAMALYGIGVMYSKGQGVEKDDKKALEYFTKAAEKGNARVKALSSEKLQEIGLKKKMQDIRDKPFEVLYDGVQLPSSGPDLKFIIDTIKNGFKESKIIRTLTRGVYAGANLNDDLKNSGQIKSITFINYYDHEIENEKFSIYTYTLQAVVGTAVPGGYVVDIQIVDIKGEIGFTKRGKLWYSKIIIPPELINESDQR